MYLGRTVMHDRLIEADVRHFELKEKEDPNYLNNWRSLEVVSDRRLYVHTIFKSKMSGVYDEKINISPSLRIHDKQMVDLTESGNFDYCEQRSFRGSKRFNLLRENYLES